MNKTLKTEELELIRQWFNALDDLKGPGYFTRKDYELACKINLILGSYASRSILLGSGALMPAEPDLDAPKYVTGWVGGKARLRRNLVCSAGIITKGQIIKILSAGMGGGGVAWMRFEYFNRAIVLRSKKENFSSHLQWLGCGDSHE